MSFPFATNYGTRYHIFLELHSHKRVLKRSVKVPVLSRFYYVTYPFKIIFTFLRLRDLKAFGF
jgi:hypothetical protein